MSLSTFFALFIGFSFLYFIWRRASHGYMETKFRLNIYRLRDDLRELAMTDQLDCDSFAFKYFDSLLSQVARDSYYISIPYMVLTGLKNKGNSKEIDSLHAALDEACNRMPAIKTIRDELTQTLWIYVTDQHRYSLLHAVVVIADFVSKHLATANKLRRRFYNKAVVDNVIYFPASARAHQAYQAAA